MEIKVALKRKPSSRYFGGKFNYYEESGKYFVNKTKKGYMLYDSLEFEIKEFRTLKEVREQIIIIKANPYQNRSYAFDINDYIEKCDKNINHFNAIFNFEAMEGNRDLMNLAIEFRSLAKREGLVISKSPYSESFYAHKEDESIDWGSKPNGSYRMSDHWNWTDASGELHCKTLDSADYGLCICKYESGYYTKL